MVLYGIGHALHYGLRRLNVVVILRQRCRLRSQCFTVSYNADLDCFTFDVYGYGPACGMSQWGAIGYARNGWSYRDILTHYFVGTTLTTY